LLFPSEHSTQYHWIMKNLLNSTDRTELQERLKKLHPDNKRNWGKLTIHKLFPHLNAPLRVALGDSEVPHEKSVFYDSLLGRGIVWFLPWPKGAPTAKEFLPGKGLAAPISMEVDRKVLFTSLARFAEADGFQASPVFGKLSKNAWGRLMWRHIDHHLKQFNA
jgi:Protein of unknown function (DUF1569)